MKDEDRYNPTNMTPTRLINLHIDSEEVISVSLKKQPEISDHTWKTIQHYLKNLRFSEDCTPKIIHVLQTRTPFT